MTSRLVMVSKMDGPSRPLEQNNTNGSTISLPHSSPSLVPHTGSYVATWVLIVIEEWIRSVRLVRGGAPMWLVLLSGTLVPLDPCWNTRVGGAFAINNFLGGFAEPLFFFQRRSMSGPERGQAD